MTESQVAELSLLLKMLADSTRIKIIAELSKRGECHVGALVDAIGLNQPAVSHHLALMRASRVIDSERRGKNIFYFLRPDWIETFRNFMGVAQECVDRKAAIDKGDAA